MCFDSVNMSVKGSTVRGAGCQEHDIDNKGKLVGGQNVKKLESSKVCEDKMKKELIVHHLVLKVVSFIASVIAIGLIGICMGSMVGILSVPVIPMLPIIAVFTYVGYVAEDMELKIERDIRHWDPQGHRRGVSSQKTTKLP